MKLTKSILEIFFFLACSLCTGYFVYLQFLYYLRNEDVASVAYRTFNEEEILRTLLIDQKLSTIPNYSPELNDIEQTKLIHYIVEGSNEIKGMYYAHV